MEVLTTYLPQMLWLIGLLLLSACFSMAETAIASASLPRMVAIRHEKKSRSAAQAVRILKNKERLITVMLLCNNLLNVFLSAYFTYFITSLYGAKGLAVATIIISVVVVVFAEVIPKNIAIYLADKIVLTFAYPLIFVGYITRPLTWLMDGISRLVIVLFGFKKDGASEADRELRGVIEMQQKDGTVEKHEKMMLRSILDLADNALDSAMTHRNSVEMISTDWSPKKIRDAIMASRYSHIPLYQDDPDKIIGVFDTKKLLKTESWQHSLNKKQLIKLVSKAWFVPISTTLAHQLQAFRQQGKHFAIVIDEYGIFKGVVTLEDILGEIVGEIEDIDKRKKDIVRTAEGAVIVKGTVTVRNLNREYGWDLPEEGINTVAGLLLREAKIVPEVGMGITAFGFHFVVLELEKQQIKKIKIRKLKIKKPKSKMRLLSMM